MPFAEDMDLFFDDFADAATLVRSSGNIPNINVIIDKGLDVVTENGLSTEKRDGITFRKDEITQNNNRILLTKDDSVVVGTKTYQLLMPFFEDDQIVSWYVR